MDFVDDLPTSQGNTSILVVVDRLSKCGHFVAIAHPYTASTIADVFVKKIFRLHGMPHSIVSDFHQPILGEFLQASRDQALLQLGVSSSI